MQLLPRPSRKGTDPKAASKDLVERDDPTLPAILEFQSPSTALGAAYSYPNQNVLTSLSAPQSVNCK